MEPLPAASGEIDPRREAELAQTIQLVVAAYREEQERRLALNLQGEGTDSSLYLIENEDELRRILEDPRNREALEAVDAMYRGKGNAVGMRGAVGKPTPVYVYFRDGNKRLVIINLPKKPYEAPFRTCLKEEVAPERAFSEVADLATGIGARVLGVPDIQRLLTSKIKPVEGSWILAATLEERGNGFVRADDFVQVTRASDISGISGRCIIPCFAVELKFPDVSVARGFHAPEAQTKLGPRGVYVVDLVKDVLRAQILNLANRPSTLTKTGLRGVTQFEVDKALRSQPEKVEALLAMWRGVEGTSGIEREVEDDLDDIADEEIRLEAERQSNTLGRPTPVWVDMKGGRRHLIVINAREDRKAHPLRMLIGSQRKNIEEEGSEYSDHLTDLGLEPLTLKDLGRMEEAEQMNNIAISYSQTVYILTESGLRPYLLDQNGFVAEGEKNRGRRSVVLVGKLSVPLDDEI
ncbi:MAG: hypothetical protein WC846_03325 [Candidatus Gracilibacteria bacterium]|jgi:hypothetical protein